MLPETMYYFKVQAVDHNGDALTTSDVVEYTHPAGKMNCVCKCRRLYIILTQVNITILVLMNIIIVVLSL